jgi:hypothetical protein
MQTIDRLGGRLTLHHNVQSGQNRTGERREAGNPQDDNRARENH